MGRIVLAAALVAVASPARADDTLVVSSVAGKVEAPVAKTLDALSAKLARAKFTTKITTVALGRAQRLATAGELRQIEQLIEEGNRHFFAVKFPEAIEKLEAAIELARKTPLSLLRSVELRNAIVFAAVAAALAHHRSGDAAQASQVMADVAVSFAGSEIPFQRFGPEPIELRKATEQKLRTGGLASLQVDVLGDKKAQIVVNERFVGVGSVKLNDVFPGEYRVFAVGESGHGRLHHLSVSAGNAVSLQIDLELERAVDLEKTPRLRFLNSDVQRESETALARALAARAGAARVLVLSVRGQGVRRHIAATLVSTRGKTLREGRILVQGTDRERRIDALVRYLTKGGEAPDDEIDALTERPESEPHLFFKSTLVGMGLGALAGAAAFYLADIGTETEAALFLGTGVVLGGAGVAIWVF